MSSLKTKKKSVLKAIVFGFVIAQSIGYAAGSDVQYHGAGWIQFGRIEHSSDTVNNGAENNFNKNWTQNTGGQITANVRINENWEGGLGLGAIQAHGSRGSYSAAKDWPLSWSPYVTEARATYRTSEDAQHRLQVTLGSFPYNYNSDVKNLGLYLLRGLVYPGAVISGFETTHVLPIATIFGSLVRYERETFLLDLILNSEMENKPLFDFSLATLMQHTLGPFEYGFGVNFYRLIPQRGEVVAPGIDCPNPSSSRYIHTSGDPEVCYSLDSVGVDTNGDAVIDTVTGTMAGTKLMTRFRLDPKGLFGASDVLGKEDLVIYMEAAVLGLKNQGKYYDNIWERIPVMMGFNLPIFGLLDHLSLEVEYYGNKNYSDYGKTVQENSWVPRVLLDSLGQPILEHTDDDWKWSLYGSRVLGGNLKLSAQIANDHLRPGGVYFKSTWAEALTTLNDWYWMMKLAYFF